MNANSPRTDSPQAAPHNPKLAIGLVLVCTVLGAAAQILMKEGSQMPRADGAIGLFLSIFNSRSLFIGYACYGLNVVLLMVALKYGELSVLYPIIALSYVWVAALSIVLYGEQLSLFKVLGLTAVIAGVAVIGLGMRRRT